MDDSLASKFIGRLADSLGLLWGGTMYSWARKFYGLGIFLSAADTISSVIWALVKLFLPPVFNTPCRPHATVYLVLQDRNLEVLVQPFNRVRHANLQSVVSRPDSRSLISSFLTILSGISSFYMPCSFQFLVLQMPRISQREFECPYWTLPCTQVIPEARKYSLDKKNFPECR